MNGNYIAAAALALIALSKRQGSMARRRQWTEEELALLGTMSDVKVAKRLGITRGTVFKKRTDLGIPADGGGKTGPKGREWTEEQIALLGTMSDAKVAKSLGISIPTVLKKRKELDIPRIPRGRQWTEEQIALLGTISDRELGERLGISTHPVFLKREELGIPAYDFIPGRKKREWSEEQIGLFGTMSDAKVAERLGVAHGTVFKKRTDLGIPAYDFIPGPKVREWSQEQIGLFGTMSSSDIAKKLGISKASVDRKKKKLREEGLTIKNVRAGRKRRS